MEKSWPPSDEIRSFGIPNEEIRKKFRIPEPKNKSALDSYSSMSWQRIVCNVLDIVNESIGNDGRTHVITGLKREEVWAVIRMVDEISK